MKRAATIPATGLALDPSSLAPRYRQLYERLRTAILSGQFGPGARLPATRTLANELGVSRHTVLLAYGQLRAEGYLDGEIGSGTTVARTLPEALLHASRAAVSPSTSSTSRQTPVRTSQPARARATRRDGPQERQIPASPGREALSERGARLAHVTFAPYDSGGPDMPARAFRIGVPALDAFPRELWARAIARRARDATASFLGYHAAAGYYPLREAIAAYLGMARGVRCTAEQVIVTVGAQGALDLVARTLLDPGAAAWIEDPGYPGARGALLGAGARLIPVAVDAQGLDVAAAVARCPDARLAYVTPSHQFPLGATLSLGRRLALLEWARRAGAWVIEDDYDSEYRYTSKPLPALQGLATPGAERVVYVGTFSKVLFPALRLGYLVAPPALVDALLAAQRFSAISPPALEQAALADFLVEGHFARHIRRMRALYAERANALVAALRQELAGLLVARPPEGGMSVAGWLPAGRDDRLAQASAVAHGVETLALSHFRLPRSVGDGDAETPEATTARGGLALGFAAVDERELREGARRLAAALR